jgi:arylsulfatase A-like enzyme
VPAGKVSQDVVQNIDVLPTILAAAGAKPDVAWKVDGRDALAVWEGKAKAPSRTLYWDWRAEGYNQLAAMRGDMKLVVIGTAPPELFNVVTDPGERRNVAAEYPELVKELRKGITDWLKTETEESKWGRQPPPKKKAPPPSGAKPKP